MEYDKYALFHHFIALQCRAMRNTFKNKCDCCEIKFFCWTTINNEEILTWRTLKNYGKKLNE